MPMGDLEKVTLCRIAKKSDDPLAKDCIIEYKNEIWIAEPFLHSQWKEFIELIQELENDNCDDLRVEADSSSSWLQIVATCTTYKSRKKKRVKWLNRIFPFLFENFVEEIVGNVSDTNEIENFDNFISETTNLIRTYMTTQLFDLLYNFHMSRRERNWSNPDDLILPMSFIPKLCMFQKFTVNWLIEREKVSILLPYMYTKLIAKDAINVVYKHRWCFDLQLGSFENKSIALPPGGILADEMGLGKTVEILALILLNIRKELTIPQYLTKYHQIPTKIPKLQRRLFCVCRKKDLKKTVKCNECNTYQHIKCVKKNESEAYEPYICPKCWENFCNQELFETKATFIVTPHIIKSQWISEIKRHVYPHLKVFTYKGIVSTRWVSPLQLGSYDIVITDYNVLRKEFHFSGMNRSDRVTRNESTTMQLKSPLLMLNWWRVCLDEAQMVESNTAAVATLARMIPGINRWAVTGTPIQQSMEDLLPLFRFIGIPQFVEPPEAWKNLVYDFIINHEKPDMKLPLIKNVLSNCMWRTCKSKVENELLLPPQTIRVHRIDFSLIEKIYYEDLHKECQETFDDSVNLHIPWKSEDFDRRTISPRILKLILLPLLRLRQCCTISVVQSGNSVPLKQFLQPKELQARLKTVNEADCKTALRTIASSYNAIAGLFCLCDKYDDAITNYLNVLELADKYKDFSVSIDSLLQIHALHNLILAHRTKVATLAGDNLDTYKQKLTNLEWKYLDPYVLQLNIAKQSFESLRNQVEEYEAKTNFNLFDTLEQILDIVSSFELEIQQAIFNRTITETKRQYTLQEMPENLFNFTNLINRLLCWSGEINNARSKLNTAFDNLKSFTHCLREDINQIIHIIRDVYDCHLSETRENENLTAAMQKRKKQKTDRKKKLCQLCLIRKELIKYECLLYDKVYDQVKEQVEGVENASMDICLVKGLLTGMKTRLAHASLPIVKELEKHVKLLEYYQLICKKLSKYWIEIEYTVKAYDELDMCKMRISFTEDMDDTTNFRIKREDIESEFGTHYYNLETAQTEFETKFARLKYIINSDHSKEEMLCPICKSNESLEYAVLECGHFTCVVCYKAACRYVSNEYLSCSICRHQQKKTNIHLLTRQPSNGDINTSEYSAKIACIIQVIWELQKHEKPKILIFSEWQPILKALSKALLANDISFRLHKSPEDIIRFKNPDLNITCLLMQYQKGSKGINLIEATHVFLVEPILNPGEELQAIGRVHRIGQTKPTTVHRFIVNKTIEEKIFNMVFQGTTDNKWDFENITVSQIKSLFDYEVE